jgi:hypothetical protein
MLLSTLTIITLSTNTTLGKSVLLPFSDVLVKTENPFCWIPQYSYAQTMGKVSENIPNKKKISLFISYHG